MVKINIDFLSDWITHLRACLIQQGWNAAEVDKLLDADVPENYFESRRRRVPTVPRILKISDHFHCPAAHKAGWEALQNKVRNGEDLNPHLSERHACLSNRDGLLAEWGVHHFHLGTEPSPRNPAYVTRTGPLVYALVDDASFCAINVYLHDGFEEVSIIESLHRNWPEMIEKYRAKGVTGVPLNKTERKALRKKSCNVLVTTSDGTVYMPIGGGVMSSGVQMESVIQADHCRFEIKVIAISNG